MLNDQTFEFSQARLKLKNNLRFTLRQSGANAVYFVEDEVNGKFYRIGLGQYVFLTMLDGRRTVATALMKTASLAREHAISESEAGEFCKWAIESGLIESETGNSTARRVENLERIQKQKLMTYMNPMMIQMRLFSPESFLNAIMPFVGWLVSPLGALIWISVVVFGFSSLLRHWVEFVSNRVSSFGAVDVLWIAFTWMLLKLVHELAHSVVCRKFGGRVSAFGFLLLLFIPMPFVDVTSSWKFDNKWKRILVSAAGMLTEIFIAAIACWIWVNSNPGPLQYHAGNVIITATLHTLLFNINPLMRFDGYYMMSDWMEISNLATQGRNWLKSRFKWMFFGTNRPAIKETGIRSVIVRVYGVAAMMWFASIAVGLSLAASSLIEGFGLVFAALGLFLWCGIPLLRLLKFLAVGTETERPNRVRFLSVMLLFILLGGFVWVGCPAPTVVNAPVVVDYEEMSIVRAKTSGFANEYLVMDGQTVKKGDLLVKLTNPQLQYDIQSLMIDIRSSEFKCRTLYNEERMFEYQLEQEELTALRQRKGEVEKQIDDLAICSPADGTVVAREIGNDQGRFLQPGDEILRVIEPDSIHAVALASQHDADWLRDCVDKKVDVELWGKGDWTPCQGKITKVYPRTSVELLHHAFSAEVGGSLAVVPKSQVENEDPKNVDQSNERILTSPRIRIEIDFVTAGTELYAGQTGQLAFRHRNQSLGQYLYENAIRFFAHNNSRNHGL